MLKTRRLHLWHICVFGWGPGINAVVYLEGGLQPMDVFLPESLGVSLYV